MKRRTVGIRHPEERNRPVAGRGQPSAWFPSMSTMAAVLSERRVPNLSRSLRMMEGYDLVRLKRDAHGVVPEALATSFKILID